MILDACRRSCLHLLILLVGACGCHRNYYREKADAEAFGLVREKANHPLWSLQRYGIEIDPRSRMFDPFNPDRPPMPPDDPASHELMQQVDGKKGYAGWELNGHTPFVENPNWMASLPLDENGVLHLTAEQAYQLALIHSRDFQRQWETLYLSALDVSTERFRFDTQFFGGYSAFYTASGRERSSSRSELELGTYTAETGRAGLPAGGVTAPTTANILMRKSFATGADFVVGLANTLVWEFAGPDQHSALTILDFSLLQPLLRRAGRDRILEQLTLAERSLLANVRQMYRFHRAFYVEIMTGRDAGTGATRRGGVYGGSGLEGFSGTGSGGFGQVGGTAAAAAAAGTGAAQAGGYLGLLQDQQEIRNQLVTISGLRSNLAQLRESLREDLAKIPENPENIVRERLQIAQARQALLNAESRLLIAQATYQASLDAFKIRIGLPPHLCVNIADTTLDQFNLIDPEILPVQNEITDLRNRVADINDRLLAIAGSGESGGEAAAGRAAGEEVNVLLARLKAYVARIRQVRGQLISWNLQRARQDIDRLKQALPDRRRHLLRLQGKYRIEAERFRRYGNLDPCQQMLLADIDPMVFNVERLDTLPGELEKELDRILGQFQSYEAPLNAVDAHLDALLAARDGGQPRPWRAELEEKVVFAIPSLLSALSDDALDLSLVQARARTDSTQLTPVDMPWERAVEIARCYRHDWMNARAALVDAWRLIEFNADNLESNLDLVFQGDIRSTGDNPIRLRTTNGQLRVGLRFDAPLTRLLERNTYRQCLIEYQQAKRNYYAYVDSVASSLRNTLRTIDLNQINFEERRIAVLSAIDQVVLNDQIQKLREERGLETGVTAARDVVSALSDLQSGQTDFLSVFVNYEVQRLNLDLDLGTMRLDAAGNWIDPGPIGPDYGSPLPVGEAPGAGMFPEPGEASRPVPPPAEQPPEELPRPAAVPGNPGQAALPAIPRAPPLSPSSARPADAVRRLPDA